MSTKPAVATEVRLRKSAITQNTALSRGRVRDPVRLNPPEAVCHSGDEGSMVIGVPITMPPAEYERKAGSGEVLGDPNIQRRHCGETIGSRAERQR